MTEEKREMPEEERMYQMKMTLVLERANIISQIKRIEFLFEDEFIKNEKIIPKQSNLTGTDGNPVVIAISPKEAMEELTTLLDANTIKLKAIT